MYDASRGGSRRAEAAAAAVAGLVPPTGRLLDVAGGTGIVSAELAAPRVRRAGRGPLTGDAPAGGHQAPGPGPRRLGRPVARRDASVDVVTAIWLLHLLPDTSADAVARRGGPGAPAGRALRHHGRQAPGARPRGRGVRRLRTGPPGRGQGLPRAGRRRDVLRVERVGLGDRRGPRLPGGGLPARPRPGPSGAGAGWWRTGPRCAASSTASPGSRRDVRPWPAAGRRAWSG